MNIFADWTRYNNYITLYFRRIPDRGNRAELVLTVLHHSSVVDEFLGQVTLPLNEMEVYERPRERRYKLQSKPGKEKKDKDRGELEVRIAFTVNPETGSMADLSKKEKKGSLMGLGGSLLSLGTLEKGKGIRSIAKSIGSKMHLSNKPKKDKYGDGDSIAAGSSLSINTPAVRLDGPRRFVPAGLNGKEGNVDPGVNSEDEDEFVFDNLSNKSSGSSLNIARNSNQQLGVAHLPPPSPLSKHSTSAIDLDIKLRSQTLPPPSKPPRVTPEPPVTTNAAKVDEWETKLYGKNLDIGSSDSLKRRSWESSRVPLAASNPSKNTHTDESPNPEHILASTAPTTPNLEDQKRAESLDKPKPLPRSATLESIEEKERDEKVAAEKTEKRFLNKIKYFSKKDRAESVEDLKSKYGSSPKEPTHRFSGERIIIGHENDVGRRTEQKVSPELLKKYDGKTREVIQDCVANIRFVFNSLSFYA